MTNRAIPQAFGARSAVSEIVDRILIHAEKVGDLVDQRDAHLTANAPRRSEGAHQRFVKDENAVRQKAAVIESPLRKRHAVVVAEERAPVRQYTNRPQQRRCRRILDHDMNVAEAIEKGFRQRVELFLDQRFELSAVHGQTIHRPAIDVSSELDGL